MTIIEDFGKLIKKKTHIYHESHLLYLKMESIRRQGKGRRVDLGGKICLIPCRASCFVSVDLRETVEFNRFFRRKGGGGVSSLRIEPTMTI